MKENYNKKGFEGLDEDMTKDGEFISSCFEWNTLSGQKEKVKKLENITKKGDKKK